MFGRDDCNSFIGIFAVIEVAGLKPLLNARSDSGVFFGFAAEDVLTKVDLVTLGPKRHDRFV